MTHILNSVPRPGEVDDRLPPGLTQSIVLEEAFVPGFLRATVSLIGGLMVVFFIWAAFATVEEVAIAPGQVIPSGYVQSVQHLEGGIVREILVRDGDLVEKDQPLLRLDSTSATADLEQMLARRNTLRLQASRLRLFTESPAFDPASTVPLTLEEQAILTSMEEARTHQQNVLQDQLAQKEKELQTLVSTRATLEKNVALKEKENSIQQQLVVKGYTSKLIALASERELNQLKGQLDEAVTQENRAQDAIREAKNRMTSLNADLKEQAMKDLGQTEAQLAEVEKSLARLESTASRTLITSPALGIVKGLTVHTVGAVVEQGKVLLEVVPVNEELIVEAKISPNDIGQLKTGQPVEVKVSAFDYSRYGSIPGRLETVSATTFQNEKEESWYRARIRLERNHAGKVPGQNLITPGMTVQANIITGDKTILQYLFRPIQIAVDGAFHER